MVNNAGILRQRSFLDISEAEFDELMAVNLKGVFFGAQAAAAAMLDGDDGSIINISSIAGIRGVARNSMYCSSKGAIRLLTYSLAAELGPEGVRVNAIHPGHIKTAMLRDDVPVVGTDAGAALVDSVPLGRFGSPDEVADAAVFLASEMAGFVNGVSLVVDGGETWSKTSASNGGSSR